MGCRGATLVEVVIALVLTTFLLGMSLEGLARLEATAAAHDATRSRLDAQRVASRILRAELEGGVPGADWVAHPPDSVRTRAFRAAARVCTSPGDSLIEVRRWTGRQVDPDKDSITLLDRGGRWHAVDLVGRAVDPTACGGVGGEVWAVDEPVRDVLVARVFESGSYHLGPTELRYRRGRSGRQPLTAPGLGGWAFRMRAHRLEMIDPENPVPTRLAPR